ncbi:hypothetical protein J5T34_03765 [Cupriavidus gilardii]|uniref:hypothetical protein n=1 Tax=Cupriavidus gilardii TaxID=82541 RepID=UPI001ABE3FA8|nr:hypothetical protein [Cupriavidus gilardii]MBO4119856.1 hypothetical protein [Cupriavidus gilardii]
MTKSKMQEMGTIGTYLGAKVIGKFGYRSSGEIDAFYFLDLNGNVLPGGVGGMGLTTEEQAIRACVEAAKERIDYLLSRVPLEKW